MLTRTRRIARSFFLTQTVEPARFPSDEIERLPAVQATGKDTILISIPLRPLRSSVQKLFAPFRFSTRWGRQSFWVNAHEDAQDCQEFLRHAKGRTGAIPLRRNRAIASSSSDREGYNPNLNFFETFETFCSKTLCALPFFNPVGPTKFLGIDQETTPLVCQYVILRIVGCRLGTVGTVLAPQTQIKNNNYPYRLTSDAS
jgi:hypothetical protein